MIKFHLPNTSVLKVLFPENVDEVAAFGVQFAGESIAPPPVIGFLSFESGAMISGSNPALCH